MSKVKFHLRGKIETNDVWLNGRKLDLSKSLKVRDHSPTGFSWGYFGSGCSQTALAILLELMPKDEACNRYQQFKFDVIGLLPQTDFEKVIEIEIPENNAN